MATNIKAQRVVVTPEQAAEWLQNAPFHRPPWRRHVLALAEEMRSGRWQPTRQAIKISADGKLLDGMHRLLACVESGLTFETLVVTGFDNSAFLERESTWER